MTQGSYLTVENSLYPASKLFKPVKLDSVSKPLTVGVVERRFHELLAQKIPLTEQEKNRGPFTPKEGSASHDFDDPNVAEWEQQGIYWVRRVAGAYAHCCSDDRLGAHSRWRNAEKSYSCAGFPFFLPETMERFRAEFELVKPVLKAHLGAGRYLLISLQREIEGAIGTCWGMRTKQVFWRLEIDGKVTVMDTTKAALHRELKTILPTKL